MLEDIIATKSERLLNKKIALCITGSIAAVECVSLARELIRHGAEVRAYLTPSAGEIITPRAIEFATGTAPVTEITGKVEHLEKFDLVLIAPASANTISKIAHGIADTPVTLLALSSQAELLIAPAMHRSMLINAVIRKNIEKLKKLGITFISPEEEEGAGKLASIEEIVDYTIKLLTPPGLAGKKVVITAGATLEDIDDVRVITNRSSGKMGIALAKEAFYLGARVVLIHGRVTESLPAYIETIKSERIDEMLKAVENEAKDADILISAAAIGDFTVKKFKGKLDSRKDKLILELTPSPKILASVKSFSCFKVGFKALPEGDDMKLIEASRKILKEYSLDLVIANDVTMAAGSNENEVIIISEKEVLKLPRASKAKISSSIFKEILKRFS